MSAYAIASGQKAQHQTLVAASVDTVTLPARVDEIEVVNRSGAAEIYFTLDGTAPTVGGTNCFVLPAAVSSVVVGVAAAGATVVKLISTGTPTYSVCRTS